MSDGSNRMRPAAWVEDGPAPLASGTLRIGAVEGARMAQEQPGEPWLQPGTVFHQVEVVKLIGAGYSGQVYKVRHRTSGELCALKLMHPRDRGNARKAERSLAEADATYGIHHDNVVEVFEIGCEPDGTTWILMELLEGETLAELLERQGRLSPGLALEIAVEVAWGLDAAHENQIIHRDVKPDNVMLTRDGRVVLLDFSVAKHIPFEMKTTQPNLRLGTPGYMAPETLLGMDVDARVDVFAVGIMLWQMLTGKHPHEDALHDQLKLIRRQISEVLPPVSKVAGLPAYFDGLLARATAKHPEDRFLTVAELAQAMNTVRTRLERDIAAGQFVPAAAPGEPTIGEDRRAKSAYHAPVTGPEVELPARAPSAKVLVAPPPPRAGPHGTLPVDIDALRTSKATSWDAARSSPAPEQRPAAGQRRCRQACKRSRRQDRSRARRAQRSLGTGGRRGQRGRQGRCCGT